MSRLRSPRGCAWDRQQNHVSLIPYLFEEAKETSSAIKNNDMNNLKEELGDVLLQVLFHAQIADENGNFDITDVVDTLARKLIRRHPHVYGKVRAHTPKEIIRNWYKIKKREKRQDIRTSGY